MTVTLLKAPLLFVVYVGFPCPKGEEVNWRPETLLGGHIFPDLDPLSLPLMYPSYKLLPIFGEFDQGDPVPTDPERVLEPPPIEGR